MLPDFNEEGYLPKGIHPATLDEIRQRFGTGSLERQKLFEGLNSLVRLLNKQKESIRRFLLNGSFVTTKEIPGDIDCILVVKGSFDFGSPEAKQLRKAKELFGTHLFTFLEADKALSEKLVDFFGHDRDQKPKGVVEVIL